MLGDYSGMSDVEMPRCSEKDLSQEKKQFYLISTPAGGRYVIDRFIYSTFLDGRVEKVSYVPGLFVVFARKIGDDRERLHYLPLTVSDISPYSELAPETEPVGCATVEEPFEKPPFEVSGY